MNLSRHPTSTKNITAKVNRYMVLKVETYYICRIGLVAVWVKHLDREAGKRSVLRAIGYHPPSRFDTIRTESPMRRIDFSAKAR